jgi:hypothetical protein
MHAFTECTEVSRGLRDWVTGSVTERASPVTCREAVVMGGGEGGGAKWFEKALSL